MIRICIVLVAVIFHASHASASRTTETLNKFLQCIDTAIAQRHDPATTAQLILLFGTPTPDEPGWESLNNMVTLADEEATSFALSLPELDDTTSIGIACRLILGKTKNAHATRSLGIYPHLLDEDLMWKYQWYILAAKVRYEMRTLGDSFYVGNDLDTVTSTVIHSQSVASSTAPVSMILLASAKVAMQTRRLMPLVDRGDRGQSVDNAMFLVAMFPKAYIVDEVDVLRLFRNNSPTDEMSFELAHAKLIDNSEVQGLIKSRVETGSGCIPTGGRYSNLFTYGIRIQDSFQRNDFMSHLRIGLEVREQQLDAWRKLVLSLTEGAKRLEERNRLYLPFP